MPGFKSTHYNNPFHKKHRTLCAEVDSYTISIKRFKMCTFEGLLVMINLELLIHFPTEYIELRLFTFCILMCWQSHSSKFISILGVLDCSNEINSWQFLCNLMKTWSLLVWKKNRNHNNDVSTGIYIIVCGSESASWIQITILVNMCLEHISICQWEKIVFWQSIVT